MRRDPLFAPASESAIDFEEFDVVTTRAVGAAAIERGNLYRQRGKLDRAREAFEHCERVLGRDDGDYPELEAELLLAEGEVDATIGEYDAARSRFERARDLFDRTENQTGVARALQKRRNTLRKQGRYESAEAVYRKARNHISDTDRKEYASILNSLGNVAQSRGDLDEAEQRYEESRGIFEDVGNRLELLQSLENLVETYKANDKASRAVERCRQALALIENSDSAQVSARRREFEITYARVSGRDPTETTGTLLYYAFQEQVDGNLLTAVELFGEVWDRRTELDEESEVFELVLDGGVGWAALTRLIKSRDESADIFDRLSDRVDPEPAVDATLAEIELHVDRLAIPPAAVFEQLSEGQTETDPGDLYRLAEIAGAGAGGEQEPFGTVKGQAFADLLASLQQLDSE